MFQHNKNGSKHLGRFVAARGAKARWGYGSRLRIEELEQRALLSVAPVGSEFLVNSFTTNSQRAPSVAFDAAGDYVVAWQGFGQDGDGYGIYAQRYSAAGAVQGSEFKVNTYTTSNQVAPQVALDAGGDFVVAWQSLGQDGDGYGVYAQRYNAAGVAQGSEFNVNAYTTSYQSSPSVAMDAGGDFVVAWPSFGQDGSNYGVYAQRYNAAGAAQGSEFQVNSYTTSNQRFPSVALDAGGDFVVAWSSYLQDGSNYGVYAQRYNAAGVAQGSEFKVNTYTNIIQSNPSVALDAGGDFVVAWQSFGQDSNGYGVFAQRYNAAGAAQGSEFQVNTYTTSSQINASVALDAGGDFVVAWQSNLQDGSSWGIYAQRYNAAGAAQDSEFQVNTYTTSSQQNPSVAPDAGGNFVVAWDSFGQDGSFYGIYAQRYGNSASVVGRYLFYNGSIRYDVPSGSNPAVTPGAASGFSDDNAIAIDKVAYLPNGSIIGNTTVPVTFSAGNTISANVSSYDRGINGVMMDLSGSHGPLTTADFTFRVGNNNSPQLWTSPGAVPTPTVLVRPGAGTGLSDRIELIWPDNTIQKQWLEVILKGSDVGDTNTGLAVSDKFFFGNAIGDSVSDTTSAQVNLNDELAARNNPKLLGQNIPITNLFDYNRDGQVNITDQLLARNNQTLGANNVQFIKVDSTTANPEITGDAGIGSALAVPASMPLPRWLVNRLENVDPSSNVLNEGSVLNESIVAQLFERLAAQHSEGAHDLLLRVDAAADALGLDDELLDSLLVNW